MSGNSDVKSDADGGFALVTVLAFLLMAAAFAVPFLTGAKIQALVTRNTSTFTQEKILLRGLMEMAGTRFFERYQDRDIEIASAVRCPAVGAGRPEITFQFQDHSGLIDLNAASAEVLAIGFESLKMARDEAAALAGEVVRYRTLDVGKPVGGGLSTPRGGYKHALFERSAELQDLLADANVPNHEIDRVFTVHSGTGTVDEAAAQGALRARLDSLNISERYFVVSDVRRGTTLTIGVGLAFANGQSMSGHAVLSPGETSGQARFLEPPSFDGSAGKAGPDAAGSASACSGFFDPALLEAIDKVTS